MNPKQNYTPLNIKWFARNEQKISRFSTNGEFGKTVKSLFRKLSTSK